MHLNLYLLAGLASFLVAIPAQNASDFTSSPSTISLSAQSFTDSSSASSATVQFSLPTSYPLNNGTNSLNNGTNSNTGTSQNTTMTSSVTPDYLSTTIEPPLTSVSIPATLILATGSPSIYYPPTLTSYYIVTSSPTDVSSSQTTTPAGNSANRIGLSKMVVAVLVVASVWVT
jgi:hypothetical protein